MATPANASVLVNIGIGSLEDLQGWLEAPSLQGPKIVSVSPAKEQTHGNGDGQFFILICRDLNQLWGRYINNPIPSHVSPDAQYAFRQPARVFTSMPCKSGFRILDRNELAVDLIIFPVYKHDFIRDQEVEACQNIIGEQ